MLKSVISLQHLLPWKRS